MLDGEDGRLHGPDDHGLDVDHEGGAHGETAELGGEEVELGEEAEENGVGGGGPAPAEAVDEEPLAVPADGAGAGAEGEGEVDDEEEGELGGGLGDGEGLPPGLSGEPEVGLDGDDEDVEDVAEERDGVEVDPASCGKHTRQRAAMAREERWAQDNACLRGGLIKEPIIFDRDTLIF